MHIPDGYSTVFPYLFVNKAGSYVDFLTAGLGGKEVGRTVGPDGQITNCRIRFGTATMMISTASTEYPVSRSTMYLYVDDANAALEQALNAGASLEMPIADMPYRDRQAGIRDPEGNIWWISQRLTDEPYDP